MAENDANNVQTRKLKKKGLPPISTEVNEDETKPAKRKPKKKKTEGDTETVESEVKPRVKKKKTPVNQENVDGNDNAVEEGDSVPAPKPRKKKVKKKTDEKQNADETEVKKPADSQGSKTSLISKEEETPRKKGNKKKKKVKRVSDENEFGESPWAEDLRTMQDDIYSGEQLEEEEEEELDDDKKEKTIEKSKRKLPNVSMITAPILRSQPLDKIFIETSNRFKGQSKSALSKHLTDLTEEQELPMPVSRLTSIDFALSTHRVFRVLTLFFHGLLAGIALWQMVIVYTTAATLKTDVFLEYYNKVAMPLQGSYYFLLAVCIVSACDRFDIGNPTRRFVLRAFTLQNGTISVIFYVVAVIINVVTIRYEDRINLYTKYEDLYKNKTLKEDDINNFSSLNAARSVFIILGWIVLSLTPNADRLGKSLKSGETGLEREWEMDKVSAA